ncbi:MULTISPECIES: addiction module antidote protein [Eikenella]|uniref:Addiction module antidote protein n=1 Tax=Eikenella exigua TaxID=2528037 RepID=A0AAE6M473_9NEIS|nr:MULTISPECIES: addiction module antidote protein [Eikenella]OAM26489.1 addiction module antitoxin [Eikenella sp. NML01-A-086]OAM43787.1 addiction module antitoxin [Eikenella sp. NML97-A-109]QED91254.1 putative addiction module antidote protein [Eikenella exigua]
MKMQKFDIAEYLDSEEMIAAYLSSVLEDGDADEFIAALGDVARAKGISELAAQTGLGRKSLYKTLSGNSKPRFDTVLKITRALGVEMTLAPAALIG